ncbi:uncharacterized protein ccdc171 [Aulostomus maculatus]
MQATPGVRRKRRPGPGEELERSSDISAVVATTQEREREKGTGGEGDGGGEGRRRGAGEESLRWRLSQLEKDKLQQASRHNQQVCRLEAELTRLRSSLERGEAQKAELQYQLTVSQRDAEQVSELSRDKHTLKVQVAELHKHLDLSQLAREEDQHALQQEVDVRNQLLESVNCENKRLDKLLQVWHQKVKSLEAVMEAERAAHLKSRFNADIIQLQVRDLEVALALEWSGRQEAESSLELLRAQFREVERAYSLERERSSSTEHARERLEEELERRTADLSVALETERKTTSDLQERLEEEQRRLTDTHALLEQAVKQQSDHNQTMETLLKELRGTNLLHHRSDCGPPSKDDGNMSPGAEVQQLLKLTLRSFQTRQEEKDKQLQELLSVSERLNEDNRALRRLISDQIQESQQASVRLQQEVTRLRQESSDQTVRCRTLQVQLEREREEWEREREEKEREREEWEREREEKEREMEEKEREREDKIQRMCDHYLEESKAHLSFLYCLYQRLLAGSVLLPQPHSILGNFTWEELCDVIGEQVSQLTADLQAAHDKVVHLQRVCEKKSVRAQELQRRQECVVLHLEATVRRREEAWRHRHTNTVTQLQKELQLCRSQCDTLRARISSLTSDLSHHQDLLTRSRRESASFLSACALLAGTTAHAHLCLQTLSEQKTLVSRRLAEKEELEEEVRRLAAALAGEEEDRGRQAARRWRRVMCVAVAVKRWRSLARQTTVLFRLERGSSGPAVCVRGDVTTVTKEDATDGDDDADSSVAACVRWLRSRRLSSCILACMADLQEALEHAGSSPLDVTSVACSSLSHLLDQLLVQSEAASGPSSMDKDSLSREAPRQANMKALVSSLQQHFLLFSQRLHSTEVERRSLRLEVANLKRAGRQGKEERDKTVSVQQYHIVCVELRQALSREQAAQTLVQELSDQLAALQRQVNDDTGRRCVAKGLTGAEAPPLPELSRQPSVTSSSAPSQLNPTPSSPLSKPSKTNERKGMKKSRGRVKR